MAVGDGVVWAESLPDNSTLAHQIDDYDRDLRIGIRSRMAREHVWSASQTATNEAGHHQFITFQQQTGVPSLSTALTQVGALYVGSSGLGYPLIFENSAGSTITLVNSAFNIPIISSGTIGGIPICSSANSNGLTVLTGPTSTTATTHLLISVNDSTGGVQNASWTTKDTFLNFGAWVDKTASYGSQEALTAGFVIASISVAGSVTAYGYTDANSTPTTARCTFTNVLDSANRYTCFTMPVKKGDYWRVVPGAGSTVISVYWIPIGV